MMNLGWTGVRYGYHAIGFDMLWLRFRTDSELLVEGGVDWCIPHLGWRP